jgi:hypothetical protein
MMLAGNWIKHSTRRPTMDDKRLTEIDKLIKAKKYITNIRNENCVVLDEFKKEIEANKDSTTTYSTLVYDNRIENCNTILEVIEKYIPKNPIMERWSPARCPSCDTELSESIGDGYYKHWYGLKVCDCGQRLQWDGK